MKVGSIGALVFLVAAGVGGGFCLYLAGRPDPVEIWATQVFHRSSGIYDAWSDLNAATESWERGNRLDVQRAEQAYEIYEAKIRAIAAEISAPPPQDDPECKATHQALTTLARYETEGLSTVQGLLHDMMAYNPPKKQDILDTVQSRLAFDEERLRLRTEAQKALAALEARHGFKVEPPKP